MQMFGVFFQYEVAPLVWQQQIMQRNHLCFPSVLPSLFLRYCSIACPSLHHRCFIVSMDNRWIIDGLLMDYLRRKSDNTMTH